ncbi:MAG: OmpA/MotB family protein [Myxococcota bacterium]
MRTRSRRQLKRGGLPGWMATFSDMVTLLMTFFAMLLAMANFDDMTRVEAVITSIQTEFGIVSFFDKQVGIREEEAYPSQSITRETPHPVHPKLREAFEKHVSDHMIQITEEEQELRVALDDRVFFASGAAEVDPAAFELLTEVAIAVAGKDIEIVVEGHTDGTGDEQRNWVLSAQRAAAVVNILQRRGVPGERLAAVGRGEFSPGAAYGDDPTWDRRIEFVLRGDDLDAVDAMRALEGSL